MARRKVHTSNRFEKDAALAVRRCKNTEKLRAVIELALSNHPLPREFKDHPLKGDWKNYRDIHIEPDWVLIYKIDDENLWLIRTGTHADLFGG
ncbi:MAG: type II toxin-antitoxin system YafQ family toxin [Desulfobacteraceae bacterium]|jgi:mRNA interferase YafQ|nr:MAG: type II toxin-antitoxin system YafQ family toxin [Desulfobacteraceae bacterium]